MHYLVGAAQGPTSSGKTSLVAHLAAATGHRCVRINNHEQTDLQARMHARMHCSGFLFWVPDTAQAYLPWPLGHVQQKV
jgi:hypothetical protein